MEHSLPIATAPGGQGSGVRDSTPSFGRLLEVRDFRPWVGYMGPAKSPCTCMAAGKQMGKQWKQWHILFSWAPKSLQMVTTAMKLKEASPWKKSYAQPRQRIKKQRHYFANKGPSSQSFGFSSSHVWMWELDYKESWVPKNWCFWTVVLEKTLESPLDCKEIQPVHPKGNQTWIFIGRTDAEVEIPILWLSEAKNWHIWKDPDARKDWRRKRGWQRMRCWVASPTWWTWVWVNSGSWWWTGRPGMLQSMGSQRVRHNWATELNYQEFVDMC